MSWKRVTRVDFSHGGRKEATRKLSSLFIMELTVCIIFQCHRRRRRRTTLRGKHVKARKSGQKGSKGKRRGEREQNEGFS